ncbi:MAG: hypothetical protein U0163_09755 [Gemmatimonadaceae bacterium]
MPRVPFAQLPDDARVWIFGASDALREDKARHLLDAVDAYLEQWDAHGQPLTCGRDWRDGRFLAIGVDEQSAGASGCSIDALFRVLLQLQATLGATIVGGGRLYYRDAAGEIQCTTRPEFARLRAAAVVDDDTVVFDTSVATGRQYRERFERPLANSWHRDVS